MKVSRSHLIQVILSALLLLSAAPANAQGKDSAEQAQKEQMQATAQRAKLRDDYVKVTNDYEASLEKLRALYEASQHKAEGKLIRDQELFRLGLIAAKDVDESELAATNAKSKVTEVQKEMSRAATQAAQMLIEVQTENKLPKPGAFPGEGWSRRPLSFVITV